MTSTYPSDRQVLAERQKPAEWIHRPSILLFCCLPTLLVLCVYFWSAEFSWTIVGHAALAVGTWSSLRLLADRPLLNPIQAVACLFHFWFGIGASACALFYFCTGNQELFTTYYRDSPSTLLIVASGLPLFGFVASTVLSHWPSGWTARFLQPEGTTFSWRAIRAFLLVGGTVYGLVFALARMGISAFDSVNYLGGNVTTSPALAALASLTQLATGFALYGFLHMWFCAPERVKPYRFVGIVGMAVLIAMNMTSGSKGAVIFIVLAPVILYFTFRQRVPVAATVSLAAVYLLFLQPFVDNARMASEAAKITTPEERRDLFLGFLNSGFLSSEVISNINLESPFRYMYAAARRITPQADDLSGPWKGRSIEDGVSSMVPRFLNEDKAESNMGNYFARELGLAHPYNRMHNVTITIPFEFVGNFGWIAGVLSFGMLGAAFAALSAWILTPSRLATHPLSPMVLIMLIKVEASCGQFVNAYKGFPVLLFVAWIIWLALGKKI